MAMCTNAQQGATGGVPNRRGGLSKTKTVTTSADGGKVHGPDANGVPKRRGA